MPIPKIILRRFWPRVLITSTAITTAASTLLADLALETETARILPPGHFEVGSAFEFQTSRNGEEYALPMAFEVGVLPHLELLVEPVPFTSIHPPGGESATGLGDLETTVTYLVIEEKKYLPALAIAGEIKFPTASNSQIGSGEYDYRIYGLASKRLGNVDLHFNMGYNIIGSPPGVRTKNPIDLELGAEWFAHPKFDLFAEVNYVGSSARSAIAVEGGGGGAAALIATESADPGTTAGVAEVAGKEIVGTVGVRGHVTHHFDLFGSFSYDNNDAKLFRTGVTFKY